MSRFLKDSFADWRESARDSKSTAAQNYNVVTLLLREVGVRQSSSISKG
jgi:hypothetical protein